MKRAYVIVPSFLALCFAGTAFWWSKTQERHARVEREKALAERQVAIEAKLAGKEYIGRDGRKEALVDIERGSPRMLIYGKERKDEGDRRTVLKERFGVSLEACAGCEVSQPLVAFANAYNAEIRNYIAAKFGATALEDVEQELIQRWQNKIDTANQAADQMPGTAPRESGRP